MINRIQREFSIKDKTFILKMDNIGRMIWISLENPESDKMAEAILSQDEAKQLRDFLIQLPL